MMSSRVRVNTATPESPRWTWIRIPSIFHSTAAGETRARAAATLLADEASISRSGRPTCRPNDRSAADAASGDAAAGRAAAATAGRDPPSRCARLTSPTGTPAARATASTITPSSAPWCSSPAISRTRKSRSPAVARPNRLVSRRPRAA